MTKVTAALTAWSKPMTLLLRCDGKELSATRKTYDNTLFNKSQVFTTAAEINAASCPSKSIEAFFESPGLQVTEVPLTVKVAKGSLLDENFVRLVEDRIQANAEDLIGYSGKMSEQAASEPTMACIIEFYGKQDRFSGIVQELTTAYFNTFGREFEAGRFTCPPTDNLAERIDTCNADPSDRTSFCNTVKLYNFSKQWFVDSYLDAKARIQKLNESQQDLKNKLTDIQGKLKADVDESDEILGIETGFGDDEQ